MNTMGPKAHITINDEGVKTTETFTYLGSKISNDGKASDEIKIRLGKAGAAFGNLINIMRNKKNYHQNKIKFVSCHSSVNTALW